MIVLWSAHLPNYFEELGSKPAAIKYLRTHSWFQGTLLRFEPAVFAPKTFFF